jgi:beta-glucosidase
VAVSDEQAAPKNAPPAAPASAGAAVPPPPPTPSQSVPVAPHEPAGLSMSPGGALGEIPDAAKLGTHATNFRFPDHFLWGAATSAHQVEGDNTNNDWWAWEQAGKVAQPSGRAADHFHRFREDFDLAQVVEHNAHRFSLEWSRIEPIEGEFSEEGIQHYRAVLMALRERHIEPVVTIFHYTLPQWLAAKGGWEHPRIERYFARFVQRVAHEFGPAVKYWITLNEPVVQVFKGYLIGQWPPGKSEWPAALTVLRRMLRAHVRAYHLLHEARPDAMVSIAQHVLALSADDPHRWLDRVSVRTRGYLFNELFVDALHHGVLRVPGLFWERLPMGRTLDFIGLNYYTRDFVRNSGYDLPGLVGGIAAKDHRAQVGKLNDLGWEVYPEGLATFLKRFARFKLPIMITENGVPAVDDEDRWNFIYLHLWQVARAISEGADVIGYLHWSLLDNYEWADGYKARFGLIEVDRATMKRRLRPSAWKLAHIIRRNEL